MKKILTILALSLILIGCSDKSNEPKELTFDEKMLLLIQECISDYNTNVAADSIIHTIDTPALPVQIITIPQIESLKDLKERSDDHSNAVYIAELPIDQYKMVFHLYGECDSFWQCGEASFEVDTETIMPNNPQLSSVKSILDPLLDKNREVFNYLYGIGADLDEVESEKYPGYYKVIYTAGIENPTSIDQIKTYVEETFDKTFISKFYPEVFESESPIYIEDDGTLYCIQNTPSITDEIVYDTSLIISSQEIENEILIDIVSSYGEIIDPELKRIIITKSENGYRLGGLY
ncbi:hypothetical protein [Anaerorhabdus sp.]|uniref:hypothetical protein n=1 Tax=Anaerorhabdus sp. TaxID=1872524 RepID=UPI002FCB95B5